MYLNFRFHFFMPLFGNFQVSFLHIVGLLGIEVVSHTSKNKYVQLYSPLTFLLFFGVLFLQEKDDKKCGGIYYLCTSNAFYFSELLYNKVSSWHLRFFLTARGTRGPTSLKVVGILLVEYSIQVQSCI